MYEKYGRFIFKEKWFEPMEVSVDVGISLLR